MSRAPSISLGCRVGLRRPGALTDGLRAKDSRRRPGATARASAERGSGRMPASARGDASRVVGGRRRGHSPAALHAVPGRVGPNPSPAERVAGSPTEPRPARSAKPALVLPGEFAVRSAQGTLMVLPWCFTACVGSPPQYTLTIGRYDRICKESNDESESSCESSLPRRYGYRLCRWWCWLGATCRLRATCRTQPDRRSKCRCGTSAGSAAVPNRCFTCRPYPGTDDSPNGDSSASPDGNDRRNVRPESPNERLSLGQRRD
jgi:hypothetical protein